MKSFWSFDSFGASCKELRGGISFSLDPRPVKVLDLVQSP